MPDKYTIEVEITAEGVAEIKSAERALGGMDRAAGGVGKAFGKWENQLKRTLGTVEKIGSAMMVMGAGIVGGVGWLIKKGIDYNVQVEQLQKKLKVFLGTQEEVNKAYEWASELTLRVPLSRRDVIPIVTILEQYGLAYEVWAEHVINAAAATKQPGENINQQMQTIANAFGRIKTGQIGIGIRMLEDAGIIVEDAGLKMDKAGKKYMDTPRVVLEKLEKYLGTKFKGAAEEFGNTWEGQVLKFKSLTDRFLGYGVAPVFDKLRSRLVWFTDWLASDAGQAKMREWATILGRLAESAIKFGDTLVTKVIPHLIKFLDWFSKLEGKSQFWLTMLPLITGGFMKFGAKLALAALNAGKVGKASGVAGSAIEGMGGKAGGAVAPFLRLAGAIGGVIAAMYAAGLGIEKFDKYVLGEDTTEDYFGGHKTLGRLAMGTTPGLAYISARRSIDYSTGKKPLPGSEWFGNIMGKDEGKTYITGWKGGIIPQFKRTPPATFTGPYGGKWPEMPKSTETLTKAEIERYAYLEEKYPKAKYPAWKWSEMGKRDISDISDTTAGDWPGGDVAAGGGGGGGGGTRGPGRAITLYQTFERDSIKITSENLDAEGFTELMGTVVKKEADTL